MDLGIDPHPEINKIITHLAYDPALEPHHGPSDRGGASWGPLEMVVKTAAGVHGLGEAGRFLRYGQMQG